MTFGMNTAVLFSHTPNIVTAGTSQTGTFTLDWVHISGYREGSNMPLTYGDKYHYV